TKAIFERTTRSITEQGGTILKDVAWGRRRMAYEIDHAKDGIYQIYVFEVAASAIAEIERVLLITEEVLRHLVIRDERKGAAALRDFNLDGGAPARLELDADDTEGEIAAAAAAAAAADGE
ncbi:MAG: 30S ribosomal protein S6, partial [Candidatus Limnocylindrus sp.]